MMYGHCRAGLNWLKTSHKDMKLFLVILVSEESVNDKDKVKMVKIKHHLHWHCNKVCLGRFS